MPPACPFDEMPDELRERRIAVANRVLLLHGGLDFPDSSGFKRGVVLLSEMRVPEFAVGNCSNATLTLVGLGAAAFDAESIEEVLVMGDGFHVALRVTDSDGVWVADFTNRQYHPYLPFPLVVTEGEWVDVLVAATGARWEIDVQPDV